jgi:hypothetical protein
VRCSPTLRGAPSDLKFRLDAPALALGQNYTFEVDGEHPLDFLGYLEPIGTYEDLVAHVENVSKDRESLLQLEAIKRLREQEGLR